MTEIRLRLIRKTHVNIEGMKAGEIVGYMKITNHVFISENERRNDESWPVYTSDFEEKIVHSKYIHFDYTEPGILVSNEWYYEGDIFNRYGRKYYLKWCGNKFMFESFTADDIDPELSETGNIILHRIIGNIHDNPELMETNNADKN